MPTTTPPQNPTDDKNYNPYLDNPELNYELDKAKRTYEKLAMWYNLPEIKMEDVASNNEEVIQPESIPEPDFQTNRTQNNFFSIPQNFQNQTQVLNQNQQHSQAYDFMNSIPMSNIPNYRNNTNNSRLTKLQASLIYGTLKTNLKTIGKTVENNEAQKSISTGGSPETKFSENISEVVAHEESKAEAVHTPESHVTVAENHKPEPVAKPAVEKSANSISSFIGNFKVYGYSPSTGILNKLIKATNPQDAWKNFEPSSAKAWLYALTGRLLAIHDGK